MANEMLILIAQKWFVFFLNIFASSDVNRTSLKGSLQQSDLPLFIKCSWIHKKYEAHHFLKMFLTEDSFDWLKHLTKKVTAVASLTRARIVVDNTMPTPPHNKVKDLALIFWSVSLPHLDFIFCQIHLEQTFCYVIFFFSKVHLIRCLSSVVNLIAVTTLLLTSGLHRC